MFVQDGFLNVELHIKLLFEWCDIHDLSIIAINHRTLTILSAMYTTYMYIKKVSEKKQKTDLTREYGMYRQWDIKTGLNTMTV